MSQFVPTRQMIWDASEHIKYEWEQLKECLRIEHSFRVPVYPDKVDLRTHTDRCLYNLALTGFAIHARNLLLFFYEQRKGKHDDIIAADYFDPPVAWIPPQVPGKSNAWREDIQSRMNKQAAHLTYSRAIKKAWEIDEIFDYLLIIWQHFIATASPQKFNHN